MNFLENKFLELNKKQLESLYFVCEYISEQLNLEEFYLKFKNIIIDKDTTFDELYITIGNNKNIYIYSADDDEGYKLPYLNNIFPTIIQNLKIICNQFNDGIYYFKNNSLEEFYLNNSK